jgi:hypothetical protein
MKARRAHILDHLGAAKEKKFREKLNERSCGVLGGNTSPSEASYSASICCSICHTPFRERGNEASIRVPMMFKSHV